MESKQIQTSKYPKIVTDLASQNHFLRMISLGQVVLTISCIIAITYLAGRGPEVIALDGSGQISEVTQVVNEQQVQTMVKEYIKHRYSWSPENIESSLKKSEAFVFPSLLDAFRKSMLEVKKFVKDRKASQRVYPQKIIVDLKNKTVLVIADRINEFESLKAATVLNLKFEIELDDPTVLNPWGVYIAKEVEGGG